VWTVGGTRQTLNHELHPQPSKLKFLRFPSAGITDVHHNTWKNFFFEMMSHYCSGQY
jgi:hypothetical protein